MSIQKITQPLSAALVSSLILVSSIILFAISKKCAVSVEGSKDNFKVQVDECSKQWLEGIAHGQATCVHLPRTEQIVSGVMRSDRASIRDSKSAGASRGCPATGAREFEFQNKATYLIRQLFRIVPF